jgi:hypothetical protein
MAPSTPRSSGSSSRRTGTRCAWRGAGGGGQNGEFFAKKPYERTIERPGGTLLEETIFFLKHTPDKPSPCP